jgi:hypothetical protein
MNFRNVIALILTPIALLAGCAAPTDDDADESANDENVGQTSSAFSVTTSRTYELGRIGGTGGNPGTLRCRDTRDVIVGVRGRTGNVIDSLGLICAPLSSNGTLGPAYTTGTLGGSGGSTSFNLQCPSGSAVSRIDAYAATYVDNIALACARAPFTGASTTTEFAHYWHSGGSLVQEKCPQNFLLTSLAVTTGNVVDSITPRCSWVGTQ